MKRHQNARPRAAEDTSQEADHDVDPAKASAVSRSAARVQMAAQEGVEGAGRSLPYAEKIQASFGRHDISGVKAHQGEEAAAACSEIGASAYAVGNDVAFGGAPDLHTAAHEAAHTVQQRSGVQLLGGVGQAGDRYEQNADAVADAVVAGGSAEKLLDPFAAGGGQVQAVQRNPTPPPVQQPTTQPATQPTAQPAAAAQGAPGLDTHSGRITDWSVAVSLLSAKWNGVDGIGAQQKEAIENWYQTANKDDPPPAYAGLLASAVGILVGAATGGIGAVITSALAKETANFTRWAVNAAVTLGKDFAKEAGTRITNAISASHPNDGMMAYKKSAQDTVGAVVDVEAESMAVKMSGLAQKDDAAKWSGLQDIYNAMEKAKPGAYQKQYAEILQGWLSILANHDHKTVTQLDGKDVYDDKQLDSTEQYLVDMAIRGNNLDIIPPATQQKLEKLHGKDWRSQVGQRVGSRGMLDEHETRQTGTLSVEMNVTEDNKLSVTPKAAIKKSKGNNQSIRDWFLASGLKIGEFKIPKLITSGGFQMAFSQDNSQSTTTYGRQFDGFNGGDDVLARYGRRTTENFNPWQRGSKAGDDPAQWVMQFKAKGIERLSDEFLNKTLKELGVTDIDTSFV
jgi:hypothetical protein